MNQYFLQLWSKKWEKVDEYIWKNWKNALDANEIPRYNGTRFTINETGEVELEGSFTKQVLGMIMRIADIKRDDTASPNGYWLEPETIILNPKFGKTQLFHNLKKGETFQLRKAG